VHFFDTEDSLLKQITLLTTFCMYEWPGDQCSPNQLKVTHLILTQDLITNWSVWLELYKNGVDVHRVKNIKRKKKNINIETTQENCTNDAK